MLDHLSPDTLAVIGAYLGLFDCCALTSTSRRFCSAAPRILASIKLLDVSAAANADGSATELSLALRRYGSCLGGITAADLSLVPSIVCNNVGLVCALPQLQSLRDLSLAGLQLSQRALAAVESIATIEALDVSGCTLAVPSPHARSNLPAFASSLRRLNASSPSLVSRGQWKIEWFGNIECYARDILDPSHISAVARCSKLKHLTLVDTRVCQLRIHGQDWRKVLGRLRSLTFHRCDLVPRPHLLQPVTEVLREALEAAPSLASLLLLETPAPSATAQACKLDDTLLRECAPYMKRLEVLHLEPADDITDRGFRAVIDSCGASLQSLMIAGDQTRITDKTAFLLAEQCPRLSELRIPFSQVTDVGVAALAASKCGRSSLSQLDVSRCNIMLASTLQALQTKCTRLKELRFWGCHAAAHGIIGVQHPASGYDAIGDINARDEPHSSSFGHSGSHDAAICSADASVLAQRAPPVTGTDVLALMSAHASIFYCAKPGYSSCSGLAPSPNAFELLDNAWNSNHSRYECECGASVRTSDKVDHDCMCLSAATPCPNAQDGCTSIVQRRHVGQHLRSCAAGKVICLATPRPPTPVVRDWLPSMFTSLANLNPRALNTVPPITPHSISNLKAAFRSTASFAPASTLLLPFCCGATDTMGDICQHRRSHSVRAEAEGLRCRCPFAIDGCGFVEEHWSARLHPATTTPSLLPSPVPASTATAASTVTEHLSQGQCRFAAYVCASCGVECGSKPQSSCGTAECCAIGLMRCRMPHIACGQLRIRAAAPRRRSISNNDAQAAIACSASASTGVADCDFGGAGASSIAGAAVPDSLPLAIDADRPSSPDATNGVAGVGGVQNAYESESDLLLAAAAPEAGTSRAHSSGQPSFVPLYLASSDADDCLDLLDAEDVADNATASADGGDGGNVNDPNATDASVHVRARGSSISGRGDLDASVSASSGSAGDALHYVLAMPSSIEIPFVLSKRLPASFVGSYRGERFLCCTCEPVPTTARPQHQNSVNGSGADGKMAFGGVSPGLDAQSMLDALVPQQQPSESYSLGNIKGGSGALLNHGDLQYASVRLLRIGGAPVVTSSILVGRGATHSSESFPDVNGYQDAGMRRDAGGSLHSSTLASPMPSALLGHGVSSPQTRPPPEPPRRSPAPVSSSAPLPPPPAPPRPASRSLRQRRTPASRDGSTGGTHASASIYPPPPPPPPQPPAMSMRQIALQLGLVAPSESASRGGLASDEMGGTTAGNGSSSAAGAGLTSTTGFDEARRAARRAALRLLGDAFAERTRAPSDDGLATADGSGDGSSTSNRDSQQQRVMEYWRQLLSILRDRFADASGNQGNQGRNAERGTVDLAEPSVVLLSAPAAPIGTSAVSTPVRHSGYLGIFEVHSDHDGDDEGEGAFGSSDAADDDGSSGCSDGAGQDSDGGDNGDDDDLIDAKGNVWKRIDMDSDSLERDANEYLLSVVAGDSGEAGYSVQCRANDAEDAFDGDSLSLPSSGSEDDGHPRHHHGHHQHNEQQRHEHYRSFSPDSLSDWIPNGDLPHAIAVLTTLLNDENKGRSADGAVPHDQVDEGCVTAGRADECDTRGNEGAGGGVTRIDASDVGSPSASPLLSLQSSLLTTPQASSATIASASDVGIAHRTDSFTGPLSASEVAASADRLRSNVGHDDAAASVALSSGFGMRTLASGSGSRSTTAAAKPFVPASILSRGPVAPSSLSSKPSTGLYATAGARINPMHAKAVREAAGVLTRHSDNRLRIGTAKV